MRRILWIQALIALLLVVIVRYFRLVQFPPFMSNLLEFLAIILAFYSAWLFPVIAFARLLLRKPDELSDFEITWSIVAGILLYFITLFTVFRLFR